jgi:sialidase-1
MNLFAAITTLFLTMLPLPADPPEATDVFPAGMNGISRYRIPGTVVTAKGTILAYAEARRNSSADWGEIEVHLRRSTDGGRTWLPPQQVAHLGARIAGHPHEAEDAEREQTVNNPVAIVDRTTGAIEFLYCVNYARCFSMRSSDDGLSWSTPVEITASFEPFRKHYDWKVIATGPGHGIQLASGRLVVPIWLAYGKPGAHAPSACGTIFSDDHGRTWQAGDVAVPDRAPFRQPNESALAALPDGGVALIARSPSQANRKILTVSADGATGWSQPRFVDALWEPVCMAGFTHHPDGSLYFSCPRTVGRDKEGVEIPGGRGRRENLSLQFSRDGGTTWSPPKIIDPGPSAYSDLTVLPGGDLLCLFESGEHIRAARLTAAWAKSQP